MMDNGNRSVNSNEFHTIFKELDSEEFTDKYDIQKLYLGIKRHWVLILISMLLWSALGWMAMNYLSSQYRTESTLLYLGKTQPQTIAGATTLPTTSMSTAIDMILLRQNFQTLKSILGLSLPTSSLEGMIDVPVPKNESNLIRIVVTGKNPNLIVDIANTLAKISVKNSQELYSKQLGMALESYKKELFETQKKLNDKIKEIEDFKSQNQYFEMTAEHSQKLKEITESRTKLTNAINDYNSLLIEYENLKREAATLPEKFKAETVYGGAGDLNQSRLLSLQAALAEAKLRYSSNNPKIKLIEEEIRLLTQDASSSPENDLRKVGKYQRNTLKDSLDIELMKMQGKVRASQKLKQDLQQQVELLEKTLQTLPEMQMKFSKLLQQKAITEDQIKSLNEAVQAIQLQLNVPNGSIELYQLADKAKPRRDGWWLDFIPFVGALFGFFFGIGSSIVREMQDKRICTAKQLNIKYQAPCLIEIPEFPYFSPKTSKESLLYFIRTLSETIDHMYRSLPRKNRSKIVALTSSLDGEGKSCLSYQLASYYLKLGFKTLLIEFDDTKNPFTDSLLKPSKGIDEYLRGEADYDQIISKGVLDRIVLFTAPSDMKELIKSTRMKALLEHLEEHYQVIVLDTPGILEVDYTINLMQFSDIKLFVIGSSLSDDKKIDDSLKMMEVFHEKPSGFILNRIPLVYIEDERIRKIEKSNRYNGIKKFLFPWK